MHKVVVLMSPPRFFNPCTLEEYSKCVRDYDYMDCSRDDDEAYYMEIDKNAERALEAP